MTAPRSLDIVIVSFNARDDLVRCLASLREAPPARPCRVIVVDNASADGSADAARATFPDALVIRQQENGGFARGNNVGIRAGRGDLVLLLNSDTTVPAGALDRLVAALEAHPQAAAAGPRLVGADGRAELSFGRMMSPWNEVRQKALVRGLEWRLPPAGWWLARAMRRERTVDWVSGACLLVWRADAEAVGLLDERYFMYAEDVDFCAALRRRGRQVLFTPAAEVRHLRGRSARTAPGETRQAYRRSQHAFYAKHHPRWRPALEWYLRLKGEWPDRTR